MNSKEMEAAMGLMRRIPPKHTETALSALLSLMPHHSSDLLSQVDQPLQVFLLFFIFPIHPHIFPSFYPMPFSPRFCAMRYVARSSYCVNTTEMPTLTGSLFIFIPFFARFNNPSLFTMYFSSTMFR